MIHHDVWPYVIAAFTISGVALAVLAALVFARLRYWSKKAQDEERR